VKLRSVAKCVSESVVSFKINWRVVVMCAGTMQCELMETEGDQ
jgi:hypothetical protein